MRLAKPGLQVATAILVRAPLRKIDMNEELGKGNVEIHISRLVS